MKYFIHHLNDLSGSPLILREKINKYPLSEDVILVTNHGNGFLSGFPGKVMKFTYIKHPNHLKRFMSLSSWYVKVFIYLLINIKKNDNITISTLIGSPLLMISFFKQSINMQLIVNEIFFRVPIWKNIGLYFANSEKVDKIYLSKFVQNNWKFKGSSEIIYPTLRTDIIAKSQELTGIKDIDKRNLKFFSVSSLIEAKGYKLFIDIAKYYSNISEHTFFLYLSGNKLEFYKNYPKKELSSNLIVEFNNSSADIYMDKDIFLGLTNPKLWIETFGQTFAEAMIMKNIVIVPYVGAQLEYIKDGYSGFVFKEYTINGIVKQIERIASSENLAGLSLNAHDSMKSFYDNL